MYGRLNTIKSIAQGNDVKNKIPSQQQYFSHVDARKLAKTKLEARIFTDIDLSNKAKIAK
jgi:hypothetical protein